MLCGAKTWAVKSCERRMLRFVFGATWKNRFSSNEIAKRCGLKDLRSYKGK